MHQPAELRIAQDCETPVQVGHNGAFLWRYAYARSADSREAGDRGQDFLALRCDAGSLAFALCDGVGQSFFGDLAARFLGEALVNWLWSELPRGAQPRDLRRALDSYLYGLIPQATTLVGRQAIPESAPSLLREVLEQKRAMGSEATFACGRVDLPGSEFERGRIVLAWMGDSRLRAWAGAEEIPSDLGDSFQTAQRWSSRAGPVGGQPSVSVTPIVRGDLPALSRVLAYSDGLHELDRFDRSPSGFALADMLTRSGEAAASDDCSYLEIALELIDWVDGPLIGQPLVGPVRPSERGAELAWEPVPEATHYEVEVRDGGVRLLRTEGTSWAVPEGRGRLQVRVRACLAAEPGEWSEPVAVDVGHVALVAPVSSAATRDAGRPEPRAWRQLAAIAVLGIVLALALAGASPALDQEARLARDWLTTATPTLAARTSPSATAVVASTLSAAPSPWSTRLATSTEAGTLAPTAAVKPDPSIGSPAPTATASGPPDSPRPSATPTNRPTATPARTASAVPSATASPVGTPTPASSPTVTRTPTSSATPRATGTPTATPSPTATRTPTRTPTSTPTRTPRPKPRATPTPSPTASAVPTRAPTP